jgi:CheY-like chemotaxis protein
LAGLGRVRRAADVPAALDMLAEPETPFDLIVAAQAYPGQFAHADLFALQRAAPLARIVALLGSWCEGETRTGKPWPGAVRTYWHQWPARARRQLARLAGGQGSAWSLPATATEEERLLADAGSSLPAGPKGDSPIFAASYRKNRDSSLAGRGLVAIFSPGAARADWLAAACRRGGYATAWLRSPQQADLRGAVAVICDGSDCRGEEEALLRRLAERFAPAPLLALLDFPRIEDCRRARAAGAAAVLSKPLDFDDLLWQLAEVTREQAKLPPQR